MIDPQPRYKNVASIFGVWSNDVLHGDPPQLFRLGDGDLANIQIGPGRIVIFGGPPGAGKTALCGQLVIDALRLNPDLRVLWANVEMSPTILLERCLARLAGVPATKIMRRESLTEDERLNVLTGLATLESLGDRLAFLEPPFTTENVLESADCFDAGLIVLDYLQRFRHGKEDDQRKQIDSIMEWLRQLAAGAALLVVSAVARQKGKGGSHYGGLNLASFRGSSEVEYGADDCYGLSVNPKDTDEVTLNHLKSRYSECRDIVLTFDREHQSFTPSTSADWWQSSQADVWTPEKGAEQIKLAALWERRNGHHAK